MVNDCTIGLVLETSPITIYPNCTVVSPTSNHIDSSRVVWLTHKLTCYIIWNVWYTALYQ